MKIQYILIIAFFCSTAVFQTGCKKEKVPPTFLSDECPDTIFYQTQIQPMLDVNCSTSGCHGAAGAGGYTLLNHAQVSANADVILSVIRHESGVTNMPLGGSKLPDSIATQMSCWKNQGTLNN